MSAWASFFDLTGHGYGIGPIPERKSVALYRKIPPNAIRTVAHFRDEQDAADFLEWMESHMRFHAPHTPGGTDDE